MTRYPLFGIAPPGKEGLDPCPFCGFIPVLFTNSHTDSAYVQCADGCGTKGPNFANTEDGHRQAVDHWNTRATTEETR